MVLATCMHERGEFLMAKKGGKKKGGKKR